MQKHFPQNYDIVAVSKELGLSEGLYQDKRTETESEKLQRRAVWARGHASDALAAKGGGSSSWKNVVVSDVYYRSSGNTQVPQYKIVDVHPAQKVVLDRGFEVDQVTGEAYFVENGARVPKPETTQPPIKRDLVVWRMGTDYPEIPGVYAVKVIDTTGTFYSKFLNGDEWCCVSSSTGIAHSEHETTSYDHSEFQWRELTDAECSSIE